MRLAPVFVPTLLLLIGCASPNMDGVQEQPSTTAPSEEVLLSIRGAGGKYVACELALEGEDKEMLVCSRESAGEWERFTMATRPDGKVSFRAANGKFVACDDARSGLLVADRDQVGEWELFTLVPKENGKMALQAWNGKFVSADFGLEGARKGALFGNRTEVNEWELFELERTLLR